MLSLETMADALSIATRVLSGEIDPNMGCNMIAAVAENLDSPTELLAFELLAHEQSGHEDLGITAQSCVPDILVACRELLGAQA
jgi:hypothetical protein